MRRSWFAILSSSLRTGAALAAPASVRPEMTNDKPTAVCAEVLQSINAGALSGRLNNGSVNDVPTAKGFGRATAAGQAVNVGGVTFCWITCAVVSRRRSSAR